MEKTTNTTKQAEEQHQPKQNIINIIQKRTQLMNKTQKQENKQKNKNRKIKTKYVFLL